MAVLDRIAAKGLRYTNFHSTALCSPTLDRDSLQNCAAPMGSSLKGAIVSRLMYLPRWTAHSSFCSSSNAPTRRMMASSLGKMPTTSVRRLISRSSGLMEWIFAW